MYNGGKNGFCFRTGGNRQGGRVTVTCGRVSEHPGCVRALCVAPCASVVWIWHPCWVHAEPLRRLEGSKMHTRPSIRSKTLVLLPTSSVAP
jgi:hypothetical protein